MWLYQLLDTSGGSIYQRLGTSSEERTIMGPVELVGMALVALVPLGAIVVLTAKAKVLSPRPSRRPMTSTSPTPTGPSSSRTSTEVGDGA